MLNRNDAARTQQSMHSINATEAYSDLVLLITIGVFAAVLHLVQTT
jgi:hypothetical protein